MSGDPVAVALRFKLHALKMLADGCPWHKGYRQKRRPTGNCEVCRVLWDLKVRLDAMERAS
jgi:hypothetical protein